MDNPVLIEPRGTASLRHDPQGKMLAQILMDFPLEVPAERLARSLIGRKSVRRHA